MSRSTCPFASASLAEHLARGAGAAVLLSLTFWLVHGVGPVRLGGAAASFAGAIVLMRGCPTCWTVGLIATLGAARRARQVADTSSVASTRPAAVSTPR